jgi:hypothetical protein
MRYIAGLTVLLWLCGAAPARGQQPSTETETLTLLGGDSIVAGVPHGSVSTAMQFTADPSADGGDSFDIILNDPRIVVGLVRPDGVTITALKRSSAVCRLQAPTL